MKNLLLSHHLAVGDVVVATALVRDLVTTHPGEFQVAFDSNMPGVWEHNPHLAPKSAILASRDWQYVRLDYSPGLYDQKYRPCHFLEYFHNDFYAQTGIRVPLTLPYPDLHLSEEEKATREYPERYWVIFAGGKNDYPIKIWNWKYAQEVVNSIRDMGLQVVQSGGRGSAPVHVHYPLENCIHDLDRADLRQLFRLIYHSEGVICGITGPMHIAAALQRPCIVTAGGRESWWWEAYVPENPGFPPDVAAKLAVPHKYLHTIGLLDCCQRHGCWMNKVVQIDKDTMLCRRPVIHPHQPVAGCLDMIKPEHVMAAVSYYYESNLLPPIEIRSELPKPAAPMVNIVTAPDPFDHPAVGGRFTICMAMYGDYLDLQKQSLLSIIDTVPRNRRQIRVGTNAVPPATLDWLNGLRDRDEIQYLKINPTNEFKYPLMRDLFSHEAGTLDQWVIWFDDDTIADKDPRWCLQLCEGLAELPPDCAAAGTVMLSRLTATQKAYYATRPWWRNKLLQGDNRQRTPDGRTVAFLHGGWWVMRSSVIRELDIPDPLLKNNGGDICIGEMLHQNEYKIAKLADIVRISTAKRRGENQHHFGSRRWQLQFLGRQEVFSPDEPAAPLQIMRID